MRLVFAFALAMGCSSGGDCGEGMHEEGGTCVTDGTGGTGTGTTDPGGNAISLDSYPPVVVATTPAAGDLSVDPTLDTLTVTFSKPMADQAWAWVQVSLPIPDIGGVHYETDTTNVATGVVLEPDSAYRVWLNDPFGVYQAFQDRTGQSAVPYPLGFATSPDADPTVLAAIEPAVVASVPAVGDDAVDPALSRIELTFSKDMDPFEVGWSRDAPKTELPIVESGFLDARNAYADVTLAPGTTYAVWVNLSGQGFRDTGGTSAAPWLLTFRTAE